MNYTVFPFGKYKGTPLRELPSTYIMLALEGFALPKELHLELRRILLGRLGVFSTILHYYNLPSFDEGYNEILNLQRDYENHNQTVENE